MWYKVQLYVQMQMLNQFGMCYGSWQLVRASSSCANTPERHITCCMEAGAKTKKSLDRLELDLELWLY